MPKFEVVMWEQRRIVFSVEAEDADHAEAHAVAVWDQLDDLAMAQESAPGDVAMIDEHDIKSTHVVEIEEHKNEPR